MNRSIRLAAAATCLGLFSLSSWAAPEGASQAIRERLDALEQAWAKGDATYAATRVFGRDAVIHGEGQKDVIQSPEAVLGVMQHLMEGSNQIRMKVHSVRVLAPTAAHSWVTWQVTPRAAGEKPFEMRSLFVWTKGKEGWRIRADMYSVGAM